MTESSIEAEFPRGILIPELLLGVTSSVTPHRVGVNLSEAGRPGGSHYSGGRYGRGEVGEFVLIEGQQSIILGRISEVRLREQERRAVKRDLAGNSELEALGLVQLLGRVAMVDLSVTTGIDAYPRLGDRVYAAPHRFIARLPQLMDSECLGGELLTIELGNVGSASGNEVRVKPERLFGRHCAILGATGGGKSWTTARIIEECLNFKSKIILVDATGEYREFAGDEVAHFHMGDPVDLAAGSTVSSLPPTCFLESDFIALFEPAGKVQGPKLRAAMRSLRLAALRPDLAPAGFIAKINQPKDEVEAAESDPTIAARLEDPRETFDVSFLVKQIEHECVWPTGYNDASKWGKEDGNFSHCLSLVARIDGILTSPAFRCVFNGGGAPPLTASIERFLDGDAKLMRICLSGIAYEYKAREIIANVIGRHLLGLARGGKFRDAPAVVVVDEAHNFLGRHIGNEDYAARLDAFELIAKEGRKYGLNICLASQRPRDITEGVLSQMGTMIVHRLTNDRDREVVERACGETDRAASTFLPNLRPGEAAIIGTDFPIPLTIQIREPNTKPISDGPAYQIGWSEREGGGR